MQFTATQADEEGKIESKTYKNPFRSLITVFCNHIRPSFYLGQAITFPYIHP